MKLTQRQALEVTEQFQLSMSWRVFKAFLEDRQKELKLDAKVFSEDITKLLVREQAVGAESELTNLLEAFTIHVANITQTNKEETNES